MIHVSNLERRYGDLVAVDGVSFDVPKGQIVGLLGHNGAGKTTVMKVLTGYLEPTQGKVEIGGLDIIEDRLAIQKKIGYLPENSPLYPEMTVLEYLEYGAHLRSLVSSEIPKALERAIQKTHLREKVSSRLSTLSKGFKQRVGVAQAILHQPEILILDEPTSGLDPSQILEMRRLIKELSEKATIMISTHILHEVEAVCDRVIIMLRGRVARDALLSDLKGSNSLIVSTDRGLEEVAPLLRRIDGVQHVELLDGGGAHPSFRLILNRGFATVSPLVASAVISKGLRLYRLDEEHHDLETVFREVTGHA